MRSVRWFLIGVGLLIAFGIAVWWVFFTKHWPTDGIYPAGSKIPDKRAPGGNYESDNFPRDLDGQDWGTAGEVSLVAFPDESVPYANRRGFAVRLINRTDEVVGFTACDSCLHLAQEALDRNGNWRPIELPNMPICYRSFHRVFLDKNQYWEFPARRYSGTFKTKLRFRLEQGTVHRRENGERETVVFPELGGRTIYSNEFDGRINVSQFVTATDK
jgi:hypothetical protein